MRALTRGAGAHHARLQRHDERAVVQPPGAERGGRVPQGEHLGMGGRVLEALALVVALGDRHAVAQHDRADRHVAVPERGGGLRRARAPSRPSSSMAEGVGFEPTVGCPTHAFQACRFGRSRIPPGSGRLSDAGPRATGADGLTDG